jgi:PIN domain nuclease of toxin-antitoxin system
MILLVDANALIRALTGDPTLGSDAAAAITDPANRVLVSVGTVWEIEIKRSAGRLKAPDDLLEQLREASIDALPITAEDAQVAARLPMHHRDPFDRLLVAQAQRLSATIVSRDRALDAYDVDRLPA